MLTVEEAYHQAWGRFSEELADFADRSRSTPKSVA